MEIEYKAGEVELSYKRIVAFPTEKLCSADVVADVVRSMPEMASCINYKELAYAIYVNSCNRIIGVLNV